MPTGNCQIIPWEAWRVRYELHAVRWGGHHCDDAGLVPEVELLGVDIVVPTFRISSKTGNGYGASSSLRGTKINRRAAWILSELTSRVGRSSRWLCGREARRARL